VSGPGSPGAAPSAFGGRSGGPGPGGDAGTAGPVFLVPLRLESAAVRRGARRARIERIGMGPDRATSARVRLSRVLPPRQPVVLLGVAGAIVDGLEPGDAVVATELGSVGAEETSTLPGAKGIAELLRATAAFGGRSVHLGPIVCSSSVLSGDAARAKAAAQGALAVDMESLWCAPLCRGRPFAVVRVILDVPGRELFSWRTPVAASAAFRSLVRAARSLESWAPVSVFPSPPLEV
jgi:4-hydroxy-3-methylbut-2-enyl diphosphate reductase